MAYKYILYNINITCVYYKETSAKEGAKIFIANKPVVSSCTFAVYLQ